VELRCLHIVDKFLAIYETHNFIIEFNAPAIASYPEPDEAAPCLFISLSEVPFNINFL